MRQIFVFSGLGADQRAFKNLDLKKHKVTFIKWITPLDRESLSEYSKRLLQQIDGDKPILIGLSFGGIVALEIAKLIEVEKIILIASAKTQKEIPLFYRLAGKLNLHKVLPSRLLKTQNFLSNWFFGAKDPADKKLLKEIFKDTEPKFLKWAINVIVKWKNSFPPQEVIHIHGTSDRILPSRLIKANFIVDKGGHFMTVNRSSEINSILNQFL